MNFNEDNTQTLQSLLTALGNGLSASTAYPILQQTIANQEAAMQERKARQQAWAEQVIGMASTGQTQGTASSIMDLLTPRPGVPPKLQNMLDIAYPNPGQDLSGGEMQGYDYPTNQMPQVLQTGIPYQQQQSPIFLEDPTAQFEQAMQEMQLQEQQLGLQQMMQPEVSESVQTTQAIGGIVKAWLEARNSGKSEQEILAGIMSDPYLAGIYTQNAQKIQLALTTSSMGA